VPVDFAPPERTKRGSGEPVIFTGAVVVVIFVVVVVIVVPFFWTVCDEVSGLLLQFNKV
jgi:hypothetical protein